MSNCRDTKADRRRQPCLDFLGQRGAITCVRGRPPPGSPTGQRASIDAICDVARTVGACLARRRGHAARQRVHHRRNRRLVGAIARPRNAGAVRPARPAQWRSPLNGCGICGVQRPLMLGSVRFMKSVRMTEKSCGNACFLIAGRAMRPRRDAADRQGALAPFLCASPFVQ